MRTWAGAAAAVIALVACTPGGGGPSPTPPEPLAAEQTLSFPIAQDLTDLDPAMIASPGEVDILSNVFSGLYRFDASLHEVPDLAVGQPTVSADGLTYTFHLRQDARFSNGDPISADDFVYSWNRAVSRQGDYAGLFNVIAGYQDVLAGTTARMSGLAAPDPYTLSVTLVRRAGYFATLVGLWPFWVVDQKVIAAAGETAWATAPDTLVGSGPFKLTARVPGQSLDFAPVPAWYGGKTGALTRVHVEVLADPAAQVAQYESGIFTLIGFARQALAPAAATHYTSDPKLASQLALVPLGVTYWLGFNLKSGPFAGTDAGQAGRHAFSQAIDRTALAAALCNQKTTCAPATGGVIAKGLQGYLGDGADGGAKFNAAAAKAEYQAWDPTGSKARGLAYTYDTNPFNKALCANLQLQWRKNLGVDVACVEEVDQLNFFHQRAACAYPLFRQSWAADYDHPQDWFDYLFVTGESSSGSCYSNPNVDRLVASAGSGPLAESLTQYRTAGFLLADQSVAAPLVYGVQQYLVHDYVRGAGGNALYDAPWTGIRILKH